MKKIIKKLIKVLRWKYLKFRVAIASVIHKQKRIKKGLFIDGGSNLGQGYSFFRKYFPEDCFDVLFIEPNPNCMRVVKNKFRNIENSDFLQKAIWVKEDKLNFFGLVEDDRGNTSSGGSVVDNHNSSMYQSNKEKALSVDAFSFSDLLAIKSKTYNKIIVKMDIESAEYEVLKDLIDKNTITKIDHLFVEFHSQYFNKIEQPIYQKLEKEIIKSIKSKGVGLTQWI